MNKERPEKKGIGWFKGVRSNQGQLEQEVVEDQITATELVDEPKQTDPPNNHNLFSKDNQDKVTLDLIISLENMLQDRQLILYKNRGLEEQLSNANETINRLKQEQMKKEQLLQEKNKEIRTLESNLTNKQMAYDQLIEDYKEYQNNSNIEYEKISNRLETEINKYNKLYEEFTNGQYQSMLKINELEEKIRNLEIVNQRYIEQHQKILDEKTELIQTINDFTERMSLSFSAKPTTSNSSDSE